MTLEVTQPSLPDAGASTPTTLQTALGPLAAATGVDVRAVDSWAEPAAGDPDRASLGVHTELHRAVIGPLVRPGVAGCRVCLALRRSRASGDRPWLATIREVHSEALARTVPSTLDEPAVRVVAAAAAALIADESVAGGASRQVAVVDLRTLEVRRHSFLPEPLCPHCGKLCDDTPERAQRTLEPRPKVSPYGSRGRDVLAEHQRLRDLYVDPFCGLIRGLDRGAEGGLVMSGAAMPLRFDNLAEPGYGRSRDYRTSELTAVLEALERYGGVAPGGTRSIVRGSYSDLVGPAVHPDVFGRHPDESYDDPTFRYRRFDERSALWWVWAHSFADDTARLVPESLAYYHCHRLRPDDPVSYYEVSNGCALGSSWEEAVLHGLMETVERDAFLCTWYARTVPPEIDLATCRRPAVHTQATAIRSTTGYDIHALDITTDYGIPAVWVMAVHPDGGAPAALCTAGAGLDVEQALLNAMNELGPILSDVIRRYRTEEDHAAEMAADPYSVLSMPDHSALYAHPATFGRLRFLLQGPVIAVDEVGGPDRLRPHRDDLTIDLHAAVERVGRVYAVDQTTDEHRAGGFACVKVLAEGAVPMTFGYRNRRTDGLPRLLELPHRMGRSDRVLRPDELNADPHPFP